MLQYKAISCLTSNNTNREREVTYITSFFQNVQAIYYVDGKKKYLATKGMEVGRLTGAGLQSYGVKGYR